ncbi:MAG: ABC transporter permease [Phycisphaeraceae bacterium]|nr:MAG: ABC transporter permease [Phycisphaeraceae bacterium]
MAESSPMRFIPPALRPLTWPLVALGLLLLFNVIFTPGYLHIGMVEGRVSGYLVDIFRDGAAVMLLAVGMTLVIATGGVDLSVGAIMAISAVLAASMVTPEWNEANLGAWTNTLMADHIGVWIAIILLVSLIASVLAGAWNGMLVSVFKIQPIIATLVLMVAGRGIAQLICSGRIFTYDVPGLEYIGKGTLFGLPFSLFIVAGVVLATYALTRATALGLMIESVGDNDVASRCSGVPVRNIRFLVYMVSGLCAGLAGLIESTNVSSANANQLGLYFELDAIFAVVVGGTALTGGRFFLGGSIIGALLLQTLTNTMYAQEVSPEIALIPKALVILAVCLLQSPAFRRRVLGVFGAGKPSKSRAKAGGAA